MKKLLVVVDMQNDFIDGSLGSPEALAIVPNVVKKMDGWDGDIIMTRDTHLNNYLETREGRYLPIKHCIKGTEGHEIYPDVLDAALRVGEATNLCVINKETFGSTVLPELIKSEGYESVELVGLCTDICVVSNAMLIKARFPELDITVDSSCCAGVTPDSHIAALTTMKMCQIKVL